MKRATKGHLSRIENGTNFNPRPREEGDGKALLRVQDVLISIHALVKRATDYISGVACAIVNFNPRPREEGDRQSGTPSASERKFQSTPS